MTTIAATDEAHRAARMPNRWSRMYTKGQVTIPKAVRDETGIKPGDRVVVEARDGEVVIRPVRGVLEFRLPPRRGPELPWPEMRRRAWEDHAAREFPPGE